jgi:hypothetical protein
MNERTMSPCYLAAAAYGAAGLHVFPCGPDKISLVKWGAGATTDLDQIRRWWTHWPDAMIGMACGPSGIVAIDIDVKDGRNGWVAIAERTREWGPLPDTRTTRTPTGGAHLLFRHPGPEYNIRNSAGSKVGEGVDVRGDGGMVIMPPSRGDKGAYVQHSDVLTVPLPLRWAENLAAPKLTLVPVEFRPCIGAANRYGNAVLQGEGGAVADAQPGQRNDTLTRSAFKVGTIADQCGVTGEQAEEMFRWAASQWRDSGELRKSADTFWRAFEAGRNNPRNAEVRSA